MSAPVKAVVPRAAPPLRAVLATGNPGKLREFQQLLGPSGLELVAQSALGIAPVEETGTTFEANALLKARHAARHSGLPALADDSGIEVDALGGAPGVYSARYAGPGAADEANLRKLLAALEGVPPERRTARYRCVLAYVGGDRGPDPVLAEGRWEGRILAVPRGRGGFGYDPIFLPLDGARAAAELSAREKNACSHRAQAVAVLLAKLSG